MKMVIQRVNHASVTIDGEVNGAIEKGFLVLLGVGQDDTEEIADKYVKKMVGLRIFGAYPVISDLRIRHGHDLAGIRGVGDDLEVAFERGVEADFPEHLAGSTASGSREDRSVLESQQCRPQRGLRCIGEHAF